MREVSAKLRPWLENLNILLAELSADGFKPTPTNAREALANLTSGMVTDIPDIAWCQDDLIQGRGYDVPVRIYHPEPSVKLPVLVYFHGGGHMAGSVTVYDSICRKMANVTQHIVVSVDYRLSPECPYPAAVNDAYHAVKEVWLTLKRRQLAFQRRLSIAGDSAGGALCATVAHLAQFDDSITIHRQAMIYPSLDYTMSSNSLQQNAVGYLLQKDKIAWYFDNYFQTSENRKTVSPLYMEFSRKLPESLVITAEFCPLRDEGFAYIDKIRQVGVEAEHLHFDNMIHAFLNLENLVKEECETVYLRIAEFLNRA
ncbi:MAG: alpha/beta hydrolase [Deltaproteobacteria bacterium]|nr:alpha/beta hydrolase [Deltaproteobacteria bacterium]